MHVLSSAVADCWDDQQLPTCWAAKRWCFSWASNWALNSSAFFCSLTLACCSTACAFSFSTLPKTQPKISYTTTLNPTIKLHFVLSSLTVLVRATIEIEDHWKTGHDFKNILKQTTEVACNIPEISWCYTAAAPYRKLLIKTGIYNYIWVCKEPI